VAILTAVVSLIKADTSLLLRLPSFGRWALTLLHDATVASVITDAGAIIKAAEKVRGGGGGDDDDDDEEEEGEKEEE